MNFLNEKELLDFLSSLNIKNMEEYLSKKMIKWYEIKKNEYVSMPYEMKIINSIVFWSGGVNEHRMFFDWKNTLLSYIKKCSSRKQRTKMEYFLDEIKVFKKYKTEKY